VSSKTALMCFHHQRYTKLLGCHHTPATWECRVLVDCQCRGLSMPSAPVSLMAFQCSKWIGRQCDLCTPHMDGPTGKGRNIALPTPVLASPTQRYCNSGCACQLNEKHMRLGGWSHRPVLGEHSSQTNCTSIGLQDERVVRSELWVDQNWSAVSCSFS